MAQMEPESVAGIVTSPPYNLRNSSGGQRGMGKWYGSNPATTATTSTGPSGAAQAARQGRAVRQGVAGLATMHQ